MLLTMMKNGELLSMMTSKPFCFSSVSHSHTHILNDKLSQKLKQKENDKLIGPSSEILIYLNG
jgi:hypothetical protein